MASQQLEPPDPAINYDEIFRFTIPSRSRAHETHVVDLDCYHLNGMCSCEHFQFNLQPLLARGVTAAQAIEQGLKKPKKDQHPDDVLRCNHIVDAWRQFSITAARAISNAKTKHTPPEEDSTTPF